MKAVFVEMPAFARFRASYLDDEGFSALQQHLMRDMEAGDVIKNSGGLRKLRFAEPRRHQGRRGGLRVIYFWWPATDRCLLYAIYRKGEVDDLTSDQLSALRTALKNELKARSTS